MCYFSRIAFILLYGFDIFLGYYLSQSYTCAVITAAVIPIVLLIWQKVTLFTTGAIPLDQCRSSDAYFLKNAYDGVMTRADRCGYNLKRAKLYLSDQDTFNAYNCGNAIVVNKPVLCAPHLLEAIIAHEVSHYKCADSYFSMLLGLNVSVSSIVLSLAAGLYTIAIIAVLVIIISIFSKNSGWWGLLLGKILMPVKNFFVNIIVTITIAIEMLISRSVEFEADRFAAAELGYGSELKLFLSNDASLKKPLTFTERLLSSHPSNERRIARIEKCEQNLLQKYNNY